jgi:triosephosphate isomerase
MTPLIAANWKMNLLPSEVAGWAGELLEQLNTRDTRADLALCAPFTHLAPLREALAGSPVALGAQDLSAYEEGAYTGEVSAAMLRDAGVVYVIVGHSERRRYHRETDALVRDKLARARVHGLAPILCVGETLEQREAGRAGEVTLGQLGVALEGMRLEHPPELAVAYEPVWAIGTGKTATARDAQEMCALIREALRELQPAHAEGIRILYGGSMKPGNARELLAQPDVNGGLVGGASLEVSSLLAIAQASIASGT